MKNLTEKYPPNKDIFIFKQSLSKCSRQQMYYMISYVNLISYKYKSIPKCYLLKFLPNMQSMMRIVFNNMVFFIFYFFFFFIKTNIVILELRIVLIQCPANSNENPQNIVLQSSGYIYRGSNLKTHKLLDCASKHLACWVNFSVDKF